MSSSNAVAAWVDEVARTTRPKQVVWCDGSEQEAEHLLTQMRDDGTLLPLNPGAWPNCYLHRSDPQDVARTEHLTFICSERAEDAGPTNNWMAPAEAEANVWPLFNGSMRGRTMYVVPYLMGPVGSPYSEGRRRDHRQPVRRRQHADHDPHGEGRARARIRVGADDWVPGLHSLGDLVPDRRFICPFPRRSAPSGASAPATAATRCSARSASRCASPVTMAATRAGWPSTCSSSASSRPRATSPTSPARFPSACGKTNLAMLRSPLEPRAGRSGPSATTSPG